MRLHGPNEPVYTIGVAAKLLNVNPQVLRMIERAGLVEPARTDKKTRLYSENDLLLLQRICYLTRVERVNLAGVRTILRMETQTTIVRRIIPLGPGSEDEDE
ncbi:MAG TPA: MerR family transcriptional regulator [Bacillota bacterium]